MKWVNKIIAGLVSSAVIASTFYFFPAEQLDAAGAGTIRQEINVLNRPFTTPASTISTSSEIVYIDPAKYSGTVTYYFEIVASTSLSLSNSVYLRNASTGATLCTVSVPTLTLTWTLLRSSACTAPTTAAEYRVVIDSSVTGTTGLRAARVIISQSFADVSVNATSTETQIEIGSYVNATTSTATLPAANPKYWTYSASKWDGSLTFSVQASFQTATQVSSSTTYTTPGTYTYIPTNGTSYTQVELWGSGGGGRCSASTQGGGGGGGGAYARSTTSPGTSSHTVVVSATSTCGTTTSNDSTYDTTTVVADGGAGTTGNTGGAGGTTANSTGVVEFAGGSGGNALGTNDTGGGGGGAAGKNGGGGNGAAGQTSAGGGGGGGNGGNAGSGSTGGSSTNGGAGGNGSGSGIGSVGTDNIEGAGGAGGSFTTSQGGAGGGPGGGGGGGDTTQTGSNGNGGRGQARLTETHGMVGIALQEDDGAFGTWTHKLQVYSGAATSTSAMASSTTFTPTDGRHYRLVASTTNASVSYTIYNAKLVLTTISELKNDFQETGISSLLGIHGGTGIENSQAGGQTFTASTTYSLKAIELNLLKNNSPVDNIYIEIADTAITNAALATSSNVSASGVSTGWNRFIFTSPVSVNASTRYYLRLFRTGSYDATNYITWRGSTSDLLPSETSYKKGDGSIGNWFTLSSEFSFRTYSDSAFTKLEPQYLLANTTLDSGASLQNYLTKWDSAEWTGATTTFTHAIDSNAQSSVVEIATAGGTQVSGSSKTASTRQATSTSMTMPANTNLDTRATTNNGDVYASRMLVAVELGGEAGGGGGGGEGTPVQSEFFFSLLERRKLFS